MNKSGSVVPLYRIGENDGVSNHQTVVFRDGDEQWSSAIAGTMDETANVGMSSDVSLQDFMSRPVRIASFTWDPTIVTYYYQNFNPWNLFFGNKRVINRINNYNNMQAKLKVKIVINGNPFYYGRLMADYQLWPAADSISDVSGLERNLVAASQRLKIFLDPSTNQAGELHLPMLIKGNAFSVPFADWGTQGVIHLREIASLKHANGSTEPINIVVYAWAEDVKLSIPTIKNSSSLVFQGDEYGDKPVSGMMSNIAKVAGSLMSIPWLSPYAKATQLAASGIGQTAKFFGFSRPVQIENATYMKRNYMGNLCNTDRGDTCTKLSVDSKQELTIDPTTIGLSACDEMAISYIATKESYLTTFAWTTLNTIDTCLFNVQVSPFLARQVGGVAMFNTAMATVGNLFDWWRGSVIFRFQIIASQYHKGRLLIVYDPVEGNAIAGEQNVQYSKIIDLSDERDFTMKVCWGQQNNYIRCGNLIVYPNDFNSAGTAITKATYSNGFVKVYVLNDLTSPNSSINNDIKVAVYVKGGDDMEFAVPSEKIAKSTYLPLTVQGERIDCSTLNFQAEQTQPNDKPEEGLDQVGLNAPENESVKECVAGQIPVDHTNDVFFGESISSVRQLMKRYVFHCTTSLAAAATATTATISYIREQNFPRYRGFEASGVNAVVGGQANVVNTSVMNYMAPCYLAYRGSLRSKYIIDTGAALPSAFKAVVDRKFNLGNTGAGKVVSTITVASATDASASIAHDNLYTSGLTGVEATSADIQPVLEVEFPHYSNLRFHNTRSINSFVNTEYNTLRHQVIVSNASLTNSMSFLHRYVAVGEDFQLFLYQGQPPLYQTTTYTAV